MGRKRKSSVLKSGDFIKGVRLKKLILKAQGVNSPTRFRNFWVCEFPNGEVRSIEERTLLRGTEKEYRSKEEQAVRHSYRYYVFACKDRNRFFGLSFKEFWELAIQDCIYCSAKPANGPYPHTNGVDRKDNQKGYTKSNCVPCCKRCNAIKSDKLSFEQMKIIALALKKAGHPLK